MSGIDQNIKFKPINFAIAVISDTRNIRNDKSGNVLGGKIVESGHNVLSKNFIKDEVHEIINFFKKNTKEKEIDAIITTGGTGLTGRDSTPEAFQAVIDKEIPGFGEMFRMISYQKIGTSALQSRACGGIMSGKFIFILPGSPSACKDAWDEILNFQFDNRYRPCNLVDLIPRLTES